MGEKTMDILSTAYYESMKRYWKRRKYLRLGGGGGGGGGGTKSKKKLKISRLGGRGGRRRLWKIRLIPKLQFNMPSPVKLLVKFHDAYIDMMIRFVGSAGNSVNIGLFGSGKVVPRGPPSSIYAHQESASNLQ